MKYAAMILSTISLVPIHSVNAEDDTQPPTVIETIPASGAQKVDPATSEIAVTFSEPMTDMSWSWVYEDKAKFPMITGNPRYLSGLETVVLPVKLAPRKAYEIHINSEKFKNFKDQANNPAIPYVLRFETGD